MIEEINIPGIEILTSLEKRFIQNARANKPLFLKNEFAKEAAASDDNFIRSDVIRYLITLINNTAQGFNDNVIHISDCNIRGDLSIINLTNLLKINLENCTIHGAIDLSNSSIGSISLSGTKLFSFIATSAKINGDLILDNQFYCAGELNLSNTAIFGDFILSKSKFEGRPQIFRCRGVRVEGSVELDNLYSEGVEFDFTNSNIGGNVEISGTKMENFTNPCLDFTNSNISGSMNFGINKEGSKSSTFIGEIRLSGLQLHGDLNLRSSRITGNKKSAIYGRRGMFDGNVILQGCDIEGEVDFVDSTIRGSLELHGTTVRNPTGISLFASRAHVIGGVFLQDGFTSHGEVRFRGSQVDGQLDCRGGTFHAPGASEGSPSRDHYAINFQSASVKGGVFLRSGVSPRGDVQSFVSYGEVFFLNSEIHAQVDCTGGVFNNNDARFALNFKGANIIGDVLLWKEFTCRGKVSLENCRVSGDIRLSSATFHAPFDNDKILLNAAQSNIRGRVEIGPNIISQGEIRFTGAEVGRSVICRQCDIANPEGKSINFSQSRIGANILVIDGTKLSGQFDLDGVRVGNNIDLSGGQFITTQQIISRDNKEYLASAISLQGAQITGRLSFISPVGIEAKIEGSLNLQNASVDVLEDGSAQLPQGGGGDARGVLYLDGFVYRRIGHASTVNIQARREWLQRQPEIDLKERFNPQPFKQLVSSLRGMGYNNEANKIIIFKNICESARPLDSKNDNLDIVVMFNRIYDYVVLNWAVGYGYRWHRIVFAVLFIWVLTGFAFLIENYRGGMVLTADAPAATLPIFRPWSHAAFKLSQPIRVISHYVALQRVGLNPEKVDQDLTFGIPQAGEWRARSWFGYLSELFASVAGWFATVVILAGLAGLIRREQ